MIFDLVCLFIVLAGAVIGYRKGVISQVGSVCGVFLGIICCNVFAKVLAERFISPEDSLGTIMMVNAMCYAMIFVICYLLGRLSGKFISHVVKALGLGRINHICGSIFAMFEYVLVFSLMLNVYIGIFPDTSLTSNYEGVKKFVLNLAPDVLGSETFGDIYNSLDYSVVNNTEV